MRLRVALVFLVACGGSTAPAPAPTPVAAPAPAPAPVPVAAAVDAAPVVPVDAGAAPHVAVASDPEEGGQVAGADIVTSEGGLSGNGITGRGDGPGGFASAGATKLAGRHKPIATVQFGEPKVKGKLDVIIVRRYLRRDQMRMRYCYEKQLLANPGLSGKVTATYTIDPEGAVSDAKATGMDDQVDACVVQTLNAIEYPKPPDDKPVRVTFALTFANR